MKNFRFESELKKDGQHLEKLIWAKNSEGLSEYCFFRKTFMCDKLPKTAVLNIFVQSKYRLYINGESVLRFDAGISENGEMIELDVLPFLKQGKNVIAIFACFYSYPVSNIELRQKGVIFNLNLDYSGARQENVISDTSVKSRICDAYLAGAPSLNDNKSEIELFDNSVYNSQWTLVDFDDFEWDYSEETDLCDTRYFDIPKSNYSVTSEHIYSAKAIIAAGTGNDKKGLSLKENFYHENAKCELNKLYVMGVECELQPIDKGQYSYILVDFDRLCNGYLKMDVDGYGGDIIDVIFAKELKECVPVISGAARFILKAENNILETNFDKNEFRYVLLVFRNPVRTNYLNGLWVIENEYNFENTSEFSCDNEKLNLCFEDSALRMKSAFSNQILSDNLLQKRTLALSQGYLTGDVLHFKNMLLDFASMQIKSGQIINKRSGKSFDFYDVFSFALAIKDYYVLSGDKETTGKLLENAIAAFKWISCYEQDGLLKSVFKSDKSKTEEFLNAMYIYAIDAMAFVAAQCGDRQAHRFYESKSNKLKKLYSLTFIEDENSFIEANQDIIYDACALLTLIGLEDLAEQVFSHELDSSVKITMPIEFIRAAKKSDRITVAYQALNEDMIDFSVVPVLVAENVLGIDLLNKKGIKLNPDIINFSHINANIFSPKGLLSIEEIVEENIQPESTEDAVEQADIITERNEENAE
ncbi:MAG: hypothetical protein IJE46_05640 [Clostridia bacterium]|nr:hypothetical protein [Clostridia bacterium]